MSAGNLSDADVARVRAALPGYEIGGQIGRGGCGVVLAGVHRGLHRRVAIKQIPPHFADDMQVRRRFVDEARMMAALDHPHVVPVYDYIEHDDLCLLVLEYLPGGTVENRFITAGFEATAAVAVALSCAAGLDAAHRSGILHRDVKPSNLMFAANGALKLTDFGIAKIVGGEDTLVTKAGEIIGTPSYIAPEQVRGQGLSPATDVYALATMLYQLLSGVLPFPTGSDALALLFAHAYSDPVPLTEVAPFVPHPIAEAVMRGLASDPAERYDTAETFGIAIAETAAHLWGTNWLTPVGIPVIGADTIIAAATGGPRGPAGPHTPPPGHGQPDPFTPQPGFGRQPGPGTRSSPGMRSGPGMPPEPGRPAGPVTPPPGPGMSASGRTTPPRGSQPGSQAPGVWTRDAGSGPTTPGPQTIRSQQTPDIATGGSAASGETRRSPSGADGASTRFGPTSAAENASRAALPADRGSAPTMRAGQEPGIPPGRGGTMPPIDRGGMPSASRGGSGAGGPRPGQGGGGTPRDRAGMPPGRTAGTTAAGGADGSAGGWTSARYGNVRDPSGRGFRPGSTAPLERIRPREPIQHGGVRLVEVARADLVPVQQVVNLPSPRVPFLVAGLLAVVTGGAAVLGIGTVEREAPPVGMVRIGGVDPAVETVVLDLSEPVPITVSSGAADGAKLSVNVLGLRAGGAETALAGGAGDVAAPVNRYVLAGRLTGELSLSRNGSETAAYRFGVRTRQPATTTATGVGLALLLLFAAAYAESNARTLRRGSARFASTVGLAISVGLLGVAAVGAAWVLLGWEPTLLGVIACAAGGAATGLALAAGCRRVGKRYRYVRVQRLRERA
ncbi:protein kinase [Nocardia sp. NPDC056611]|uniref:serine/threonine-protein kinase n=1 Tax=Nocardia sp. NPDC056611 TaxID=3345877 RepID=UPI00366E502B